LFDGPSKLKEWSLELGAREAWRGWAEFAVIAEVLSPSTSSCDNGIPGSLNLTASPTSPSFFGFDVGISSF
jgi:hypothetical protein